MTDGSPETSRPALPRLDQVLRELGFVTDAEIRSALHRQRSHGGRLGENLVELGHLSRNQLMQALSRQFGLPWRHLEAKDIPSELADRIPHPGIHGGLMVPLSWDAEAGNLVLAVNDPADVEALQALRSEFGASGLELYLVPDQELAGVRQALAAPGEGTPGEEPSETEAHGEAAHSESTHSESTHSEAAGGGVRNIEPSGPPTPDAPGPETPPEPSEADASAARRVLMITPVPQNRSFLPTVFAREGVELDVVDGFDEVADALKARHFDAVLVDAERAESLQMWVRGGKLPPLPPEVGVFPSVSGALLANPVPYAEVVRSLQAMVEALAELRTRDQQTPPPYGLLSRDARALARAEGLPTVSVDALHLAVHLLLPPRPTVPRAAPRAPGVQGPFEAFSSSRELAVRMRFPWPVEEMMDRTLALFLGGGVAEPPGRVDPRVVRAAQILALVWFHHILTPSGTEGEDDSLQMRTILRQAGTRLAPLDLVEAYLRVIEERRKAGDVGDVAQVLLVGAERVRALGARLARSGLRPVVTRDLMDAQAMAERRTPDAILVDDAAIPGPVDPFARVAKLDAALLLYVITDSGDPSYTLGLLEAGIDDVFSPPHDLDLVAARIVRAVASRSRVRSAFRVRGGAFSATLEAFSFLDLVQRLQHGLKSVRIELSRPSTGEEAVLFLDGGRPVHAASGDQVGPEVIYRVMAWGVDGEFTVHAESDIPPPTLREPLEALLMEGRRRLDEGRS